MKKERTTISVKKIWFNYYNQKVKAQEIFRANNEAIIRLLYANVGDFIIVPVSKISRRYK